MTGEPAYKPHSVYYFGSKSEYVDYLSPTQGPEIAESLGFYDPPKSGGNRRVPAYFFRDPGGQLPVTATLYHEVSHQLLFETAGPNAYTRECGQLLGLRGARHLLRDRLAATGRLARGRRPCRAADRGGDQGAGGSRTSHSAGRIHRARPKRLQQQDPEIYLHYQQAMALTVFFMQWHDGTYRDAFLDYVRDAYRGRIKHGVGPVAARAGSASRTRPSTASSSIS